MLQAESLEITGSWTSGSAVTLNCPLLWIVIWSPGLRILSCDCNQWEACLRLLTRGLISHAFGLATLSPWDIGTSQGILSKVCSLFLAPQAWHRVWQVLVAEGRWGRGWGIQLSSCLLNLVVR